MRSVSTYGQRWFGVYTDVAAAGTVRIGDTVTLDPPPSHGAVAATFGRMAERVKRNTVRTGNRLLPR